MLCKCALRVVYDCVLITSSYRMFEPNMDEYLDEEVEFVKQSFEMTCRAWEKTVHLLPTST